MTGPGAPRWLVRVLERVVPADRQDELVGDLEELHRRRSARRGRLVATAQTLAEGCLLLARHGPGVLGRALLPGGGWGVSRVELRLALRLLAKQPVTTLTAVGALGVGIGIVAGGFSVFHQGLSTELPFPDGERWVTVESFDAATGRRAPMELEHYRLLRASAPALAYLGAAEPGGFNVVHANGELERIEGARVTPGTFRHLPYSPLLGRLPGDADGRVGAQPVALLRESLWERRYGRSPDVLGRALEVAGRDHLIVGVLPDDARYPSEGELWLSLPEATLGAEDERSDVGGRLVGILAAGVTPEQAARRLQQVADRVAAPGRGAAALRLRVERFGESLSSSPAVQLGILVFMLVLVSVLVVIAANVANLVVARTSRRSAELAVRTALGASRGRLVGQLFVEMLVVGGLAALLGLAAAGGLLELYDRVLDELPFWIDLRLRPSTAAAVAALALLAAAITGALPALRATGRDPGAALREAGRGASPGIGRLGGAMIAVEVALSVALIGSAALFAEGFRRYVDPSFDLPDERVLTARIQLDVEQGASPDSLAALLDGLTRSLARLPDVEAVGLASHLPRTSPYPEPVELEGGPDVAPAPVAYVGPGLFPVLEVQPLLGRGFEATDTEPSAPAVAIVNRAFALERFGTTQVVGRRLRLAGHEEGSEPAPWREIVGVVPDVMEVAGSSGAAGVYVPFRPRRFFSLAVRATVGANPVALARPLRRVVYDLDPELAVSEVVRLDQVGEENRLALGGIGAGLLGIGLVTLVLSLAGVYSIVSLAVTRRTREIGVRVALGADPRRILWAVLRRSSVLVLAGAIVGAAAGHGLSRLRLFVFAVPDGGAWLFPGLVVLMGLAGAAACWLPARRALAIQPVEALRHDA